MSFNGSGTFNINTAGQPVVTATTISSTVFNALTADLATGLTTCITKDGQTTTTASIPFALGIKITAAQNLYLDGGNNTYISEVGADIINAVTGGTEHWRTTLQGYFKASNSGTYSSSTGTYHELYQDQDSVGQVIAVFENAAATATNQFGISIALNGDPNDTTRYFIGCVGNATTRLNMFSNGNLVNINGSYGAISDSKFKDKIVPASDQLTDVKALSDSMVNYESKFSPGKKLLGWEAQAVQAISPGAVNMVEWDGEQVLATDEMTIMKKGFRVLGQLISRIEALEAK